MFISFVESTIFLIWCGEHEVKHFDVYCFHEAGKKNYELTAHVKNENTIVFKALMFYSAITDSHLIAATQKKIGWFKRKEVAQKYSRNSLACLYLHKNRILRRLSFRFVTFQLSTNGVCMFVYTCICTLCIHISVPSSHRAKWGKTLLGTSRWRWRWQENKRRKVENYGAS